MSTTTKDTLTQTKSFSNMGNKGILSGIVEEERTGLTSFFRAGVNLQKLLTLGCSWYPWFEMAIKQAAWLIMGLKCPSLTILSTSSSLVKPRH